MNEIVTKICKICKKKKPINDFGKNGKSHRGECKSCNAEKTRQYYKNHALTIRENAKKRYYANPEKSKERNSRQYFAHRERNLERNKIWQANNREKIKDYYFNKLYGFSITEFEEMYRLQKGECAICKKNKKQNELYVDHNHRTNCVRGLLCSKCNFGIGQFEDDVSFLERAIAYLKSNNV